jgi:hypothetical protein
LKADKKTIKILKRNLKEEQAFGNWLEKNNPRIAKRLMTKQSEQKKKKKITAITSASDSGEENIEAREHQTVTSAV